MNKEIFITDFKNQLMKKHNVSPENAQAWQIHDVTGDLVMNMIDENWKKSQEKHLSNRCAYYLSMEFLMGRAVFNNLLCLGIYD